MSGDVVVSGWLEVAAVRDVELDGTLQRRLGERTICLYSIDGGVFATDDACTHGAGSLADGIIEGDCIECPLHQGKFHIPTGKAVAPPCTIDLHTYSVKIVNDMVLLREEELG